MNITEIQMSMTEIILLGNKLNKAPLTKPVPPCSNLKTWTVSSKESLKDRPTLGPQFGTKKWMNFLNEQKFIGKIPSETDVAA